MPHFSFLFILTAGVVIVAVVGRGIVATVKTAAAVVA